MLFDHIDTQQLLLTTPTCKGLSEVIYVSDSGKVGKQ